MYTGRDFLRSIGGKIELDAYIVQHATRFAKTVAEINRLYREPAGRATIRVLDCASHTGALSVALKAEGYDVSSVDLQEVVDMFKERYERNQIEIRSMTDPTKLPYEDESFDCIIFAETLEHIFDTPLKILAELKRVLKSGGFLVLTTPNVMRLENKLKFLLNINIYQDLYRYVYSPRLTLHYREYTKRELATLLGEHAQFQVVRIVLFDSAAARTPFRKLVQKTLYLLNYIIPGFRGVLLAVARKRSPGQVERG